MSEGEKYLLTFSPTFVRAARSINRKNPDIVRELTSRFPKLASNPELGKPLRHTLRNYRRMHIGGSFVLLYEIRAKEVYLLDFDHHDRIYKKYS